LLELSLRSALWERLFLAAALLPLATSYAVSQAFGFSKGVRFAEYEGFLQPDERRCSITWYRKPASAFRHQGKLVGMSVCPT